MLQHKDKYVISDLENHIIKRSPEISEKLNNFFGPINTNKIIFLNILNSPILNYGGYQYLKSKYEYISTLGKGIQATVNLYSSKYPNE